MSDAVAGGIARNGDQAHRYADHRNEIGRLRADQHDQTLTEEVRAARASLADWLEIHDTGGISLDGMWNVRDHFRVIFGAEIRPNGA